MQSEQQFEQLMLQYNQIKNSSEEISRMIDNDNIDDAITMIKGREQLFLSCKCIRNYLELTPVQKKELDELLDEIRTLELNNMKKLEDGKNKIQAELKKNQANQKIKNAYNTEDVSNGSIINLQD